MKEYVKLLYQWFRIVKKKMLEGAYVLANIIRHPAPGSDRWLVGKEIQYGGYTSGVDRNKVSDLDPRTGAKIQNGGMVGGDRMLHHAYGPLYSKFLKPFVESSKPITLVEVGILRGTGLAIWCDLFPAARVIGLDIDLGHFKRNKQKLRFMGAFKQNEPETYEFDQFTDNIEYLEELLDGATIDVCIDDGYHSKKANLRTFASMYPHLSNQFVYFIEDNECDFAQIESKYSALRVHKYAELTVVTPDIS